MPRWDDEPDAFNASPQCIFCTRLRAGNKCVAFPQGIPPAISSNRHDHREPFPGDDGILFDPEPVPVDETGNG